MSYDPLSKAPRMAELEKLAEEGDYAEIMTTERARVYSATDRHGNRYLCRNLFAFYDAEIRAFIRMIPVKVEDASERPTRRRRRGGSHE